MIYAATGHRPNKLGNEYDMKGPISKWIFMKILDILDRDRPDQIISGMALGVDTIFAICGIQLGIPVKAAIPFEGQECKWPESSQKVYNEILSNPLVTKFTVCPGGYAAWKMQRRNEWMVDRCDKLVAVWDGTPGGTGNCVGYAQNKNKEIIRINPCAK